MSTSEVPEAPKRTIKRGALFASKERMEAWQQAVTIAHEQGSDTEARELLAQAKAPFDGAKATKNYIGNTKNLADATQQALGDDSQDVKGFSFRGHS